MSQRIKKFKGEGRERGALGKDEKRQRQAFQALGAMQTSCLVEVL
jgi:hypothetical protein